MSKGVGQPSVRWNAVCIDCSPADFDVVVALYRDLLGLKVLDQEERWALLRDPNDRRRIGVNVQAEDWFELPVSARADACTDQRAQLDMIGAPGPETSVPQSDDAIGIGRELGWSATRRG